jgi:hypothetical protein
MVSLAMVMVGEEAVNRDPVKILESETWGDQSALLGLRGRLF